MYRLTGRACWPPPGLFHSADQPGQPPKTSLSLYLARLSDRTTTSRHPANPWGWHRHIRGRPPLLRLERTSTPPEVLIARHPRFYGKILSMVGNDGERQIVLEDINGMSGGPIFGLRLKGGDLDDRLVAVQGSWGAQSRVVAASLIRPLMTAIARRLTQMIAEQAAAQDAAMRTKSTRSATQLPATHTRN